MTTTQAHSGPEPVADALPRLAGSRNFGLVWFGEGISILGSMTTTLVFPLLAVTEFDAGARDMGFLAAATWLPWLLISLPAGVWIDRGDARRIMIRAGERSGRVGFRSSHPGARLCRSARRWFRLRLLPHGLRLPGAAGRGERRSGTSEFATGGHGIGDADRRPRAWVALSSRWSGRHTPWCSTQSPSSSRPCAWPGCVRVPCRVPRRRLASRCSPRSGPACACSRATPMSGISRCRAVCPTSRSRAMAPS